MTYILPRPFAKRRRIGRGTRHPAHKVGLTVRSKDVTACLVAGFGFAIAITALALKVHGGTAMWLRISYAMSPGIVFVGFLLYWIGHEYVLIVLATLFNCAFYSALMLGAIRLLKFLHTATHARLWHHE